MIELLRKLKEDNTLQELYKQGIITHKAFLLLEFDDYVKSRKGMKKTEIVKELSASYRMCERTVWYYLSAL